jgi:hypothetical protein
MTSVEAGTYRNSVLRGFLILAESADSFADLFFLVIFLMLSAYVVAIDAGTSVT